MVFAMPNLQALKEAANYSIVLQLIKESCNSDNKEIARAAEAQYKIGLKEMELLNKKAALVSYIELDK